ncbi:MAG: DEAD/DEAH box helicase [Patescibacteria group bacterium]
MFRNKSANVTFGKNGTRGSFSFSRGRSSFGTRTGLRTRFTKPKRGEFIDPARFVNKSSGAAKETGVAAVHRFGDFALCREIQQNLVKRSFTAPTPIQDQSIEPILLGRDLIGLADTGTGKTAAFLLPLIDKVFKNRSERVLIITPTRELAQQVETEFRQFSWDMKIFSCACVGGLPIGKQISMLRRFPNFVIGTPGRLKDLCDRGAINYANFNTIVLDEVDRMLDMGFIDEITMILNKLPETRQSLFFSATLPDKIKILVRSFLKDPVTVQVKTGGTSANIDQDVIRFNHSGEKLDELKRLLARAECAKVLIFSETKREVEALALDLARQGFRAESIHGDKKQHQRQRALMQFKSNIVNILVATDVAARGLDIQDVTHVINYTLPHTYNDYIHRIGRTGRCNKKGTALTFVQAG